MHSAELYSPEQINIPLTFPDILKLYAKAAIRTQPYDLLSWTFAYFRALANGEQPPVKEHFDHPPFTHPTGLTPSYLRILFNQFGRPTYGTRVALKTLFDRWQGIALTDLLLYRILMIGSILHEEIDLYRFLAVACGLMGNNLRDTMILVCEVLTSEPPGGSAMIPVRTMANLYGYLAGLDCTDAPAERHEIASGMVEMYSPSTSTLRGTLLPPVSGELGSICTCEVSAKSLKNWPSSESCFELGKVTQSTVTVKTVDDDKGLENGAHWSVATGRTSTEVLENDDPRASSSVDEVGEKAELPHDDNGAQPLNKTTADSREMVDVHADESGDQFFDEYSTGTEETVCKKSGVDGGEVSEEVEGEWMEKSNDNAEHRGLENIRVGICECLAESRTPEVDGGKKMRADRAGFRGSQPLPYQNEVDEFVRVFVRRIVDRYSSPYVDYDVPGIGAVVNVERVNAVLVWLMECSRRQQGLVGPRNLAHFMCPPMFS